MEGLEALEVTTWAEAAVAAVEGCAPYLLLTAYFKKVVQAETMGKETSAAGRLLEHGLHIEEEKLLFKNVAKTVGLSLNREGREIQLGRLSCLNGRIPTP